MPAPLYDFTARRIIDVGGVRGYNPGDGMFRDAVEKLGLVVGVDVDVARPDQWQRPSDSAKRGDWVDYAVAQGMSRAEADDLTRAELVDRFPDPDAPKPEPKPAPKKASGNS